MTDKLKEPGTIHRVKKARKAQLCRECTVPIAVGTSYLFLNSFDEQSNRWKRYILCPSCERIWGCLKVAEIACGTEESYVAGRLRIEVSLRREIDNDFNHEYQIAWLASEPTPIEEPS